MKSDYTTNSRYLTHTIAFWKVGRTHFLSSGVKGLTRISTDRDCCASVPKAFDKLPNYKDTNERLSCAKEPVHKVKHEVKCHKAYGCKRSRHDFQGCPGKHGGTSLAGPAFLFHLPQFEKLFQQKSLINSGLFSFSPILAHSMQSGSLFSHFAGSTQSKRHS